MKRLSKVVAAGLVLGAMGYALYAVCLSDEAKQSVARAAEATKKGYEDLKTAFGAVGDAGEQKAQVKRNQAATLSQWEGLGY